MKPKEKKPAFVYRVIDKKTGAAVGSYSRACCDEFDFNSEDEARNAHFDGLFKDEALYSVKKYRVTYEEVGDNNDDQTYALCPDPVSPETRDKLIKIMDGLSKENKADKILSEDDIHDILSEISFNSHNGDPAECDRTLLRVAASHLDQAAIIKELVTALRLNLIYTKVTIEEAEAAIARCGVKP